MKLLNKILIFIILMSFLSFGLIIVLIYVSSSGLPKEKIEQYQNFRIEDIAKDQISRAKTSNNHKDLQSLARQYSIPLYYIEVKNHIVTCTPIVNSGGSEAQQKEINHAAARAKITKLYLQNIISRGAKINDVGFYFYPLDSAEFKLHSTGKSLVYILQKLKEHPPIFVEAASKYSKKRYNIVLFPDDYNLSDMRSGYYKGWDILSKQILEANTLYPWKTKINQAVWRGKPWKTNKPRNNLVKMSKDNKLINALGTYRVPVNTTTEQVLGFLTETLALNLSLGNFISQVDQVQYKMLLNIDGYSCTYPGYQWRLLSNSITLKQETDNIQWFYELLKPWVHFVPIQEDLSDLVDKINWVLKNENEARKIAHTSSELAKQNLMPRDIEYYVITLLNLYAAKQTARK